MTSGGFFSLVVKSTAVVLGLSAAHAVFPAAGLSFRLNADFTSGKKSVCLSEVVSAENLSPRDAEKIARYCQIELKSSQTKLSAKEVELHAWAAGVIPEKISGAQIVINKSPVPVAENKTAADTTRKIRRGSPVTLVLKSRYMSIAREAVVLMDAFPGETVDVRPHGTRKSLRARLVDAQKAELIP